MSCSNCTDYQARRANVKFLDSDGEKRLVHTINSTMVATTRFLRIFIETFQTPKGTLKIPAPLQKYINGKKEIGLVGKAPSKAPRTKKAKSAKKKPKRKK